MNEMAAHFWNGVNSRIRRERVEAMVRAHTSADVEFQHDAARLAEWAQAVVDEVDALEWPAVETRAGSLSAGSTGGPQKE